MKSTDITAKEEDMVVQVKAQVMTRDDSKGGWVPVEGGGMSSVGLQKIISRETSCVCREYIICGHRIVDKAEVLHCTLRKDVQYTKANPTFHHWKTGERRFGLTFQNSADARAFSKAVKAAMNDLHDGSENEHDIEIGDDEVFTSTGEPSGGKASSSPSTPSTATSSPSTQSLSHSPSMQHHLPSSSQYPRSISSENFHRVYYFNKSGFDKLPSSLKRNNVRVEKTKSVSKESEDTEVTETSYVQFEKDGSLTRNEYSYPALESLSKNMHQQRIHGSVGSLKYHHETLLLPMPAVPTLPTKTKKGRKRKSQKKELSQNDRRQKQLHSLLSTRHQCVYCKAYFVQANNRRGSCKDAPDSVRDCIERVTCLCCVNGLVYHCVDDSSDSVVYRHPCACDTSDEHNCRRWTTLAILSLFIPCLWCYCPLTACHRCGVACGCCGGRHSTVTS